MGVAIVIPARLASSRLPGKVLADIAGKPMLQHVYERAVQAASGQVVVAADSEQVCDVVTRFGGTAVLTDPALPSGTARIASIIDELMAEVIINVQADQPLVEPDLIARVAQAFSDTAIAIATPVWRIEKSVDLFDPGVVKVVRGLDGRALYFSRAPIPFVRDAPASEWLQNATFWGHYGIYGYRREVLENLNASPTPGQLEQAEKLEQLRLLEAGHRVDTIETHYRQIAVDAAEDLETVLRIMVAVQ